MMGQSVSILGPMFGRSPEPFTAARRTLKRPLLETWLLEHGGSGGALNNPNITFPEILARLTELYSAYTPLTSRPLFHVNTEKHPADTPGGNTATWNGFAALGDVVARDGNAACKRSPDGSLCF